MTLAAAANALKLAQGAARSEQLRDAGASNFAEGDRERSSSCSELQPALAYISGSFRKDSAKRRRLL